MSLSTFVSPEPRAAPPCFAAPMPAEFDVPLPADLRSYGRSVHASLCGAEGAPVVVVLGGISADHCPCCRPCGADGWWPGLAGDGFAVDPTEFRILGIAFAADESGRQAPTSHEQAQVICAALDQVEVRAAHAIVGASYGGMIALAIGQHFPERAERLVAVSAPHEPHPSATAIRELQRRVVALGIEQGAADEALSIARGLAMLTYRTPAEFEQRFAGGIRGAEARGTSAPGAYLRARGDAYRTVMSPQRFLSLSASIDRHRVDPEAIRAPTLLVGAESDQLVLATQLRTLAARLGGPTTLRLLPSLFGHDMFLKEAAAVSALVGPFLRGAA